MKSIEEEERQKTKRAIVNAGLRNISKSCLKTKDGAIEKMGQLSMFFAETTKNETDALRELVRKVDLVLGAINQEMEK